MTFGKNVVRGRASRIWPWFTVACLVATCLVLVYLRTPYDTAAFTVTDKVHQNANGAHDTFNSDAETAVGTDAPHSGDNSLERSGADEVRIIDGHPLSHRPQLCTCTQILEHETKLTSVHGNG